MYPVDSAIHCLNNWSQKAIGSTSVEYSAFFSEPPASLTEKKKKFSIITTLRAESLWSFDLSMKALLGTQVIMNWSSQLARKKTVNEADFDI